MWKAFRYYGGGSSIQIRVDIMVIIIVGLMRVRFDGCGLASVNFQNEVGLWRTYL